MNARQGKNAKGPATRRILLRTAKRLTVWLFEMVFEGLLLLAFLTYDAPSTPVYHTESFVGNLHEILVALLLVESVLSMTGYHVTTALCRVFWRGGKVWSYSIVAAALFAAHLQLIVFGGIPRAERLLIRGSCSAFVCSLVGSVVLRKWAPAQDQSKPPSSPHQPGGLIG